MKFLKNITAEHAALLAIGVKSHSDTYSFIEALEQGRLVDKIIFLDEEERVTCTFENDDKIKNYLLLLIDAIHFEMNKYIKYVKSGHFNLHATIAVSDIKTKPLSVFTTAPFGNDKPDKPDLTTSLLDKESVANWFKETEEPCKARRIDPNVMRIDDMRKKKIETSENFKNTLKQLELSLLSARAASNILKHMPVTIENIDRFKTDLPDVWREALFGNIATTTSMQSDVLMDDDTPDKLYYALSAYNQVWKGFDRDKINLPKIEEVTNVIKNIGITEPGDITAIARLIIPDGISLGGRPSANKEKWQAASERQA